MSDLRELSNAILLVEDDPDDEELAVAALKEIPGHRPIVIARDGPEALRYIFDGGNDAAAPDARPTERPLAFWPRIILLDLKVGGLEVLQRLRADPRARLIPVVMVIASGQADALLASYQSGANSCVCKPVRFDRFADALRQVGWYWLVLNEPPAPA